MATMRLAHAVYKSRQCNLIRLTLIVHHFDHLLTGYEIGNVNYLKSVSLTELQPKIETKYN